MAYRQQGVDTAIVRIFHTTARGYRHDGRAIPTFLHQAIQDRPLTVFAATRPAASVTSTT